jgi:putative tryptophan/tyrosine transport system substrate-binding protein
MDRRAFIGGLALGTLAAPHIARAQPRRKGYRIGILSSRATTSEMVGPQPQDPHIVAFLRGMRELGYAYGEHFVTEPRGGEGKPERFPGIASELVRLQVDVIVASGPILAALKQATSTIPVVTSGAGDPLASGFVQSLGRPGGNITGMSLQILETMGKRLELLKELVPDAAPVGIVWDPRVGRRIWQEAQAAAREREWKLLSLEIRDASEIEKAFKAATGARASALLVAPSGLPDAHARRIAELAIQSRLPVMYAFRFYVEAGGLISYGVDLAENYRRAAAFVDKILNGAKPADLPIEQPTKFELVINLNAARSIGLAIPQLILSRADEVIQ